MLLDERRDPPSATPAAPGDLRAPLLGSMAFALLMLAPFIAGALGVPRGMIFSGTLKALGDEGVYMAAVRQGVQGEWLWHDPFMVHPPSAVLMYPTYMFFGHVGALLALSVPVTYVLMHAVAGMALFSTLWLLATRALPHPERFWFVLFALGMSGLYWLAALLAALGHAPASLAWMAMPPLSGITSALMGAHETLGTAGQVLVITGLLGIYRFHSPGERRHAILWGCTGTALVGLTLPMLLPVTVAMAGIFAGWQARCLWRRSPGMAWRKVIVPVGSLLLPGLLIAAYYSWQLDYGGWAASSLRYTGSRPLGESLLQWGAVLPLGAWGWYAAPARVRPLAQLLGLWCCCAVAGMLLPFWQGFRFSTGITTMVGALFALGVSGTRWSPRVRERVWLLVSLGALTHLLFTLSVLAAGRAQNLYMSADEVRAMRWLGAHTTMRDVVLAPLGFSNRLASFAATRLVEGHLFLTFDMALRERQLRVFYGASGSTAARLAALCATGATYVVYDARDAEDGSFDPRSLPALRTVFVSSGVAVLRVER